MLSRLIARVQLGNGLLFLRDPLAPNRLWLEAVEQGMAVRDHGALLGVPRLVFTIDLGSRSSVIGPINLDVKCAGARSAGNPHATCDVAGAGN